MKKKNVIELVKNIRNICPSECQFVRDSKIQDGEMYSITIRIPVDKCLGQRDYRKKFENLKSDKLTIEGFRYILGYIGLDNIDEDDVTDELLSQKILIKDYSMDSLDVVRLYMTLEEFFHVKIPDVLWYDWDHSLKSLTVEKMITDFNNIIK